MLQTEPTDLFHIFLGFITGFLYHFKPLTPISLVIALAFTIYEASEREALHQTYFDFIEFLVGFMIGLCFGAAVQTGLNRFKHSKQRLETL